MFLPLYPQGPIYHWPVATLLLIVANLIGFTLQQFHNSAEFVKPTLPAESRQDDPQQAIPWQLQPPAASPDGNPVSVDQVEGWRDWALSHGEGLHPVQWLTSIFMHGNVAHLLGNMLFLYVFGLLVEGRAGSITFALLYLAMGITQSAFEQALWLGAPGGVSLGASSAIYATMVLAMIWMPKDEIKCLVIFMFRPFLFDVPALLFGLSYVLWDFGSALFTNFEMSTPLLHVTGAAVGLVAAIAGLKWNWLDTENGDLHALLLEAAEKEPPGRTRKSNVLEQRAEQAEQQALRAKLLSLQRSIELHVQAGNYQAAVAQFRERRRRDGSATRSEPQLRQLFSLAFRAKDWHAALDFGRIYLENFDQPFADQIRLALGKFLTVEQNVPQRALKLLRQINPDRLTPAQQKVLDQLLARCQPNSTAEAPEPN